MGVTVTLDDRELRAALRRIKGETKAARKAAVEAAAAVVVPALQEAAPKASGKAAGSITADPVRATGDGASVEIGPTGRFWYLRLHEKGTSKMGAQPFVEPTIDSQVDELVTTAGSAYLKEIGL